MHKETREIRALLALPKHDFFRKGGAGAARELLSPTVAGSESSSCLSPQSESNEVFLFQKYSTDLCPDGHVDPNESPGLPAPPLAPENSDGPYLPAAG